MTGHNVTDIQDETCQVFVTSALTVNSSSSVDIYSSFFFPILFLYCTLFAQYTINKRCNDSWNFLLKTPCVLFDVVCIRRLSVYRYFLSGKWKFSLGLEFNLHDFVNFPHSNYGAKRNFNNRLCMFMVLDSGILQSLGSENY